MHSNGNSFSNTTNLGGRATEKNEWEGGLEARLRSPVERYF